MAIPLKINTTVGRADQFLVADALNIDAIEPRSGGNLVIGATLGASDEVRLGVVGETVRVLGDFAVDGAETITTSSTITGTFAANGDVDLGDNSGDTIDIGGGTSDTVNLNADLTVGAGLVHIGSSVSDYLAELWLIAVNDNGPDAAAYNLAASGTNAGAYSIGVDPSLISASSSTDLMTMLDDLDDAISGGASTLQATYATGNTIDVTSGNGIIDLENSTATDTTTVLKIHRAPGSSTAGIALELDMGANTTGIGASFATAGSGTLLQLNTTGSGSALDVQDGGSSVIEATGAGAVSLTPTSGQDLTLTAAGAGVINADGAAGVNIDSSAGAINIGVDTDTGAINIGTGASARTITVGSASSTEIEINGDLVDVNSDGAIELNAAGASNFTVDSANLTLSTTTSGTLAISSVALLDVNTATMELDATGAIAIESSGGAISIGADAVAQNINIGTGAAARTIAIGNASSTEIQLDAILIDLNAGASGFTIDGGAGSTIATSAGNLSLDSAAAELVFDDVGNSGITLSQSSDRTLDQTGSNEILNGVTSIIGAVNALVERVDVDGVNVQELPIENTVVIAAGDVVAASSTSGRITLGNGNSNTNSKVTGIAITGGTGDVGGTVICRFAKNGSKVTDSGASFTPGSALFLPDGTGRPVGTAPSGTGDAVKRVGWAVTSTEYIVDLGVTCVL